MRCTHHVCDSYLIIRLTQLYTLSVTTVEFYAGGRYKLLNQCKSNLKSIFHVVIPHEYQYGRKMMKNNGFYCDYRYSIEIQEFGVF